MLVIGLTGGIGTGKTEVATVLNELGVDAIDVDAIGHESYRRGSQAWRELLEEFGDGILTANDEIDRKKLAAIVFEDSRAIERLNAIVRPPMLLELQRRVRSLEEQSRAAVVVEAALLLEAGWASLADEVWVTTATEQHAVERVERRSDLDAKAVRARIGSQMRQEERVEHADVVIENDGSLEELRSTVQALWKERVAAIKESSPQT